MDPVDLRHGQGSREDRERVLARAASALEQADVDVVVECAAQLFEPHHDDGNARRLLLAATDLFPDDTRPLFWLAKIAVHKECDDDRAREYLEAALKREPDRPECLSLLVSLLLDAGELGRCRELAERLVERAPDWPNAHTVWAQVMERMGRLIEAENGYSMALRMIDRPISEDVPDTYFERVVSGRRAERALKERLAERLVAIREAKG